MRLAPQPSCASCAICLTTSAATIGTSTSRGAPLLTSRSMNCLRELRGGGQKYCRKGVNSCVALHHVQPSPTDSGQLLREESISLGSSLLRPIGLGSHHVAPSHSLG